MYRPTREGQFLEELLKEFEGVLVSDFYAAYDSLDCEQQKCLIHLIRDLNNDLHKNPFDEELKTLAHKFAALVRSIVDTIDRYGLKRRHLNKYKKGAKKFYDQVFEKTYVSEVAVKYQKRLEKNREKLFTFLNHDGVSWNNNIAEHAIRHFAVYRKRADGVFSERGLSAYLVLLSIYQTCRYKGMNFLDFLLSGARRIP